MKKIIAAAVLMFIGAGMVKASNYPSDYYNQNVRVVQAGPAIVANVSGGAMGGKYVIGYKRTGILGGAENLTAVVRTTYASYSGGTRVTERTVQIGKEWQGTGFMTPAMSLSELAGDGDAAQLIRLELAFVSGSQWDSNWGANYTVKSEDFRNAASYSAPSETAVWNFILGQMRN